MLDKNDEDSISPLEKEFLLQARRLDDDDLRRIIAQARALVELSSEEEHLPWEKSSKR
jgi:hypothetical protein